MLALKNRYNGRSSRHQSDLEIACHSLELMRINLQDAFNKEVDVIVKKYIQVCIRSKFLLAHIQHMVITSLLFGQMYFRPAMTNIKENLIKTVLNDDYVSFFF